jgi:hypothetical protein
MAAMSVAEAAAFAASRRKIFVIAGHGTETPGSFQLSDECDVIVKKNTCEVAFESDFHDAMEGLLSLPEEVAQHPTQHMKKIIQRLGSVMVYSRNQPRINGTEGSCINLIYHLMMMHFREDDHGKHVKIHFDMGSGIIDFARWKAARTHVGPPRVAIVRQRRPGMPPTIYNNTANNIDLIGGLYEHSIFPTMEFVEIYLKARWKEEEVELYDMLMDLRMQPFVNVTQQFLCRNFPGVYYHMICRSMAKNVAPQIKEYVAQWQNWKKGNAPVNVKKIIDNRLFKDRHFIESVRRRHALHNYYDSHLFQEKQHTTNKANCRNLEARITSMEGLLDAVDQQERAKIQRKIRLLRAIRNEKHADCVRREAQRAAERVEAAAAAAQRSRSRSHSKSHSRSRSQSPTRNHNQTRRQSHQTRNQTRRHANKQSKSNKK